MAYEDTKEMSDDYGEMSDDYEEFEISEVLVKEGADLEIRGNVGVCSLMLRRKEVVVSW